MKAFITVLATDNYLFGVLVLYKSLIKSNSIYQLHVCVTENLSSFTLDVLNHFNIKTINVKRRDSPKMPPFNKWKATYTKLELFKLVQYSKIVYLDADMYVLHNIDHLFNKPHMSAVYAGCWAISDKRNFNSGLLVLEPSLHDYNNLIHISETQGDICQGDQNVMQKYYTNWPSQKELHLDHSYNLFSSHVPYTKNKYYFFNKSNKLNPIYVIHYICPKPWDAKDDHMVPTHGRFLYDIWHNTLSELLKD